MSEPSASDIHLRGLFAYLPASAQPYAVMARLDRPIGWWLLLLPGWWMIALYAPHWGAVFFYMAIFLIGAVCLRAAGCVINDMWDRHIDKKIARTATRPLAAGTVSLGAAFLFLALLGLIGLGILLQLPYSAWLTGIASLPLIIIYPLAKRITGWPQAVLGLTFSWGILLAASCFVPILDVPLIWIFYVGTVFWVIGYDTIYAVQDLADDALTGVKSSALTLGRFVHRGVALFYMLAAVIWAYALYGEFGLSIWILGWLAAALHMGWQVRNIRLDDPDQARQLFISNRDCGLLLLAGLLLQRLIA